MEAARQLDISLNRLNEIVLGKRGITADTALRLARMLKTSVIEAFSPRAPAKAAEGLAESRKGPAKAEHYVRHVVVGSG